jgi:hypothetical protein
MRNTRRDKRIIVEIKTRQKAQATAEASDNNTRREDDEILRRIIRNIPPSFKRIDLSSIVRVNS